MASNLPTTEKLTEKQLGLIEAIKNGMSWTDAAINQGYSESTAKNIKSLMSRSPAFIDRFNKEVKNQYSLDFLPHVLNARKGILKKYNKDGANYENYKTIEKTLERIEKITGIDTSEQQQYKPSYVNIAIDARKAILHYDTEPIQDAEVVND